MYLYNLYKALARKKERWKGPRIEKVAEVPKKTEKGPLIHLKILDFASHIYVYNVHICLYTYEQVLWCIALIGNAPIAQNPQ